MVHALTALLFPLAILASLGTIGWMLMTYGSKMLAALRMQHDPARASHTAYEDLPIYHSARKNRTAAKQAGGYVPASLARAA